MHLAYLDPMRRADLDAELSAGRRQFLRNAGATLLVGGVAPSVAFAEGAAGKGFKGSGRMGMGTGEDWIDTFFNGGAAEIVHHHLGAARGERERVRAAETVAGAGDNRHPAIESYRHCRCLRQSDWVTALSG